MPSGACWIGSAPVVDKIRNRLWFMLKQNGSPHATLQEAWHRHGEDAFTFEVLEELADDLGALTRERLLKERAAHWREVLKAQPI